LRLLICARRVVRISCLCSWLRGLLALYHCNLWLLNLALVGACWNKCELFSVSFFYLFGSLCLSNDLFDLGLIL
jgi:hypothetical protein